MILGVDLLSKRGICTGSICSIRHELGHEQHLSHEVRSFEILRCLGADLLDNDIKGARRHRVPWRCCAPGICLICRFGGEAAAAR